VEGVSHGFNNVVAQIKVLNLGVELGDHWDSLFEVRGGRRVGDP